MTFTIAGWCQETKAVGVALATYSLGVGGYCPAVVSHRGVVVSQAAADPRLMLAGRSLLGLGLSAQKVVGDLVASDDYPEYRQILSVDIHGRVAAHTGTKTASDSAQILGRGCVVGGNALGTADILEPMINWFGEHSSLALEERLLGSLEAGRDAGGQFPDDDTVQERSAALVVHRAEEYPYIDLRVDVSSDAITDLRRAYDAYLGYIPLYYETRPKDPMNAPTSREWELTHLGA